MVSFKHEKNSHGIFINFHLFALKHEQENNIMMLYGYKSIAIKRASWNENKYFLLHNWFNWESIFMLCSFYYFVLGNKSIGKFGALLS